MERRSSAAERPRTGPGVGACDSAPPLGAPLTELAREALDLLDDALYVRGPALSDDERT